MTAVSRVSRRTARDLGGGSHAVPDGSVGAGAAPGEDPGGGPGRVTAASSIASWARPRIGGPPSPGWPGQRPAGHRVDALRYARPELAGPGCPAVRARRGRERARSFPRPVSGERGIQQPGQAAGVRQHRVAILRPGERREDPQAGDRDLAVRAAPQGGRAEAQVREPGFVRDGQRVSGLGDHAGRLPGIERARREQVGQAGAGRPSGDDEQGLNVVIGIEDPGQPRIADPARGACGRHDLGRVTRTRRQDAYHHRAGEHLVGGPPFG